MIFFIIIIIIIYYYFFIIFLLLLELFILGYIYIYIYIYLHGSLYIVCVAYPLNVRSTMEIRRSHLCDFFLVFPFFILIIIIIIMAGMAVFNVAGYLIEERRRWPVITASPRGQCSK